MKLFVLFFLFTTNNIINASVIDTSVYNKKFSTPEEIATTVTAIYEDSANSYLDDYYSAVKNNAKIDTEGYKRSIDDNKKSIKVQVKDPNEKENYAISDNLSVAYNHFTNGDIEDAIEHYQKALNNKKNNTEALFGLGSCYQILGDNEKAKTYYLTLLKIRPKHTEAISNLMLILAESDLDLAIKTLQNIAKENALDATLLSQLGTLINQSGEYGKAARCLKMALDLDPNNSTIMCNLAATYDAMHNKEGAIKFYNMCLENIRLYKNLLISEKDIAERLDQLKR